LEALAEWRSIRSDLGETHWDENLLANLKWLGRWDELHATALQLKPSARRDQLMVAATTILNGADAAVREGERLADEAHRHQVIQDAAQTLLAVRQYAAAADLLDAFSRSPHAAAALRVPIEILRRARRFDQPPSGNDPADLVRRAIFDVAHGTPTGNLFARGAAPPTDGATLRWERTAIQRLKKLLGVQTEVALDLTLSTLDLDQDGDAAGYRVRAHGPPQLPVAALTYYVVREDNAYKLVATSAAPWQLGSHVLRILDAGKSADAARWLDWIVELAQSGTPTDPFSSPPLRRFWGPDRSAPASERLAAATLLSEDASTAERAIEIVVPARAAAQTDAERLACDLTLAHAYQRLKRWGELLAVVAPLARGNETSAVLFRLRQAALWHLKRLDEYKALAEKRLAALPNDVDAQRTLGGMAMRTGRWDEAESWLRKVIVSGPAVADDYNTAAWNAVARRSVNQTALDDAQRAVSLSQRMNHNLLNTLATVLVELERPTDARATLIEAIAQNHDQQLSPGDNYVLGRIAEEYGLRELALASYAKVTLEPQESLPSSCRALADRRVRSLAP
jgi:hypothetical protein